MNEPTSYPMTKEAYEKLKAELKHKLEVEKSAMAARLKAAIEMGDLSENAEYHSAKEDQGFLQGRIDELQRLIRGAVIIEDGNNRKRDHVDIGATVTLIETGMDEPETFQIVGKVEAGVAGKISYESPLGKALMGRKVGDKVSIDAPDGKLTFTVKKIG